MSFDDPTQARIDEQHVGTYDAITGKDLSPRGAAVKRAYETFADEVAAVDRNHQRRWDASMQQRTDDRAAARRAFDAARAQIEIDHPNGACPGCGAPNLGNCSAHLSDCPKYLALEAAEVAGVDGRG